MMRTKSDEAKKSPVPTAQYAGTPWRATHVYDIPMIARLDPAVGTMLYAGLEAAQQKLDIRHGGYRLRLMDQWDLYHVTQAYLYRMLRQAMGAQAVTLVLLPWRLTTTGQGSTPSGSFKNGSAMHATKPQQLHNAIVPHRQQNTANLKQVVEAYVKDVDIICHREIGYNPYEAKGPQQIRVTLPSALPTPLAGRYWWRK